jgi:hypothetical protein
LSFCRTTLRRSAPSRGKGSLQRLEIHSTDISPPRGLAMPAGFAFATFPIRNDFCAAQTLNIPTPSTIVINAFRTAPVPQFNILTQSREFVWNWHGRNPVRHRLNTLAIVRVVFRVAERCMDQTLKPCDPFSRLSSQRGCGLLQFASIDSCVCGHQ